MFIISSSFIKNLLVYFYKYIIRDIQQINNKQIIILLQGIISRKISPVLYTNMEKSGESNIIEYTRSKYLSKL